MKIIKGIFKKIGLSFSLVLALTLILSAETTFAADRFFLTSATASCDNTTANTDCWSTSTGGAGGASVPGASDIAIFDVNSENATIDSAFNVIGISLTASYTEELTQANTITVGSSNVAVAGGTFTGATQAIDLNGFGTTINLTGGTFTATSGTTSLSGGINYEDEATFNNNGGEFLFDTGFSSTIDTENTSITFNDFTINKSSDFANVTLNDDSTSTNVEIDGALALTNGKISSKNASSLYTVNGTVTYASTFDGCSNTGFCGRILARTTSDITLPDGVIDIPNFTLDNTNKADLTVTTSGTGELIFKTNLTVGDGVTFTNSAAVDITIPQGLTINGTFNANTSGAITMDLGNVGNNTYVDGSGAVFNAGSGIISLSNNSSLWLTNGATFNGNGANITLDGTTYVQTGGTFNAGSNQVTHGSTVSVSGESLYDTETATLDITGPIGVYPLSEFDATTSDLNLYTWHITASSDNSLLLNGGTFKAPQNGQTFNMEGGIHRVSTSVFIHNNGTVNLTGSEDDRLVDYQIDFYNLVLNKGPSNRFDLNSTLDNIDIANNLTITSGILEGNDDTFTVGGNWTTGASGSFDGGTGTVVFDGANQSIYGDNSASFFNFTKVVTSPDTLYFESGETQRFTGLLTLTGTTGNILALKSTDFATNVAASVDPEGTVDIDYVSVEDVNNIEGGDIDLSSNAENIDLGENNTGWIFAAPYTVTIPEFPTYLLLLVSVIGIGLIQHKIKTESVSPY